MKPLLTLAAGTALLTAACSGPEHRLSDPRADKAACALYERLFELRDRGVMLGQQDALAYGHQRYEPGFSDIYDMTGDYPAVVGWEIGHVELGAPYSLDSVYFDDIRRGNRGNGGPRRHLDHQLARRQHPHRRLDMGLFAQ